MVLNMNFFKKWYTYQKERFPILVYGSYILAIVIGVFFYTNFITEHNGYCIKTPSLYPQIYKSNYILMLPMFIVAFLQFLMIRIIDEFKDYEEDCKYRPYRPVPRGLISLKELKVLFIICAILQLIVTAIINPIGILFLIAVWIFFAIMSKGFFIKNFLDKHLLAEVLLDELMMPILILYVSSFIGILEFEHIWKLLLMGYVISWIVEIARKVRCKEDEEQGVRTYTALFGIKKAVLLLATLETIVMIILNLILGKTYFMHIIGIWVLVNIINLIFVIKQNKMFAKLTELMANLYIFFAYISLILLII